MEVKIEKVVKHERKKNRYVIHLEDGSSKELVDEILLKFGLRSGDLIDEKRLDEIISNSLFFEAKNSALRLLARRMRSEKEISDKLKQKKFDESTINLVLNELKRIKLIDDEDYTKRFISDSISIKKPYGKMALLKKLQYRGIDKRSAQENLSEMISFEDEVKLALVLGKKKMNLLKKDDSYKKKQKIATYLAGR